MTTVNDTTTTRMRSDGLLNRLLESRAFMLSILTFIFSTELATLVLKSPLKRFWYDELFTYYLSGLHPFSHVLEALHNRADAQPPMYYLIVYLARALPGNPHILLRLPSIVGYLLTLLGVYTFASKRLSRCAGLAAVLIVTLTPFRDYAIEARPYAMMVGCLAMAAVVWQRIDEGLFPKLGFTVCLTIATALHYYAVVALIAFGLAELTYALLEKRFRVYVWLAMSVATGSFLLVLPNLLLLGNVYSHHYWSHTTFRTLFDTYPFYLGLGLNQTVILLGASAVIAIRALAKTRGTDTQYGAQTFKPHEHVLSWGLLMCPAALVVLTLAFHGGYTARYGWPAIIGITLGFVFSLETGWRRPLRPYAIFITTCMLGLGWVHDVKKIATVDPTPIGDPRLVGLSHLNPEQQRLPIIVADALLYLEADFYSPQALKDRLQTVLDEESEIRLLHQDTFARGFPLLATFAPVRFLKPAAIEASREPFILISGGEADWLTRWLLERRYALTALSVEPRYTIFLAESHR